MGRTVLNTCYLLVQIMARLSHFSVCGEEFKGLSPPKDHLQILRKKADEYSRRILSPRLTETDVAIFHRSIYIPSMRYSLAAVAADEESLGFVQTNVLKSM